MWLRATGTNPIIFLKFWVEAVRCVSASWPDAAPKMEVLTYIRNPYGVDGPTRR